MFHLHLIFHDADRSPLSDVAYFFTRRSVKFNSIFKIKFLKFLSFEFKI